jgi:hypothetical protein
MSAASAVRKASLAYRWYYIGVVSQARTFRRANRRQDLITPIFYVEVMSFKLIRFSAFALSGDG